MIYIYVFQQFGKGNLSKVVYPYSKELLVELKKHSRYVFNDEFYFVTTDEDKAIDRYNQFIKSIN